MNAPLNQQIAEALRPQVDVTTEWQSAMEDNECPYEFDANEIWATRMNDPEYAGDVVSEAVGTKTNVQLTSLAEMVRICDTAGVFLFVQEAIEARLEYEVKLLAKELQKKDSGVHA